MDDAQDVVVPCSLPAPAPLLFVVARVEKSIRGVAVAPHLGATPKRGSSVLHNVHGRALPAININTSPPIDALSIDTDGKAASPARAGSRKTLRRSSSFSQAIRELSTDHLRTLDSIDILTRNSEQSQNEVSTSPQRSPRAGSKVLPRRRSYVLHNDNDKKAVPQGKLLRQSSLLKNLREMATVVPKPPGLLKALQRRKHQKIPLNQQRIPTKHRQQRNVRRLSLFHRRSSDSLRLATVRHDRVCLGTRFRLFTIFGTVCKSVTADSTRLSGCWHLTSTVSGCR